MNRRNFLGNALVAGAGWSMLPRTGRADTAFRAADEKPALLGGSKAHPAGFPSWPVSDSAEAKALMDVLHSGSWGRLSGRVSSGFETEYAKRLGVAHTLAVSSGTSALYTMLGVVGIGPGDEVILPVYTFVATYNVVTLNYALPVLIDTDPETFQIDAGKIEAAVTRQTKVLMPVHIGGSPFEVDRVLAIAEKHRLPVIEDACQAHLAEWKGRKVGSFGLGGAFSFQSSKNLNCAEGGAITSNDGDFIRKCYSFHNQGQGDTSTSYTPGEGTRGSNLRLTEFQSALLLAQMTRLEQQARKRSKNADYLTRLFNEIPGISPARLYEGTTCSAYHLYMFRYDKAHFDGLSRERFMEALRAEGVYCSAGYGQMNRDAYVTGLATNRHYLKIYGEKAMKQWMERNHCPQNDLLTGEQAIWFTQTMLLGSKTDMEQIADAVRKIQTHAGALKK
ncbi:MAG: DegT/DnrJ/EryC1/StrS family aminotransferase [Tannerella sp.]|jgi:dTDP-4-amino-4,6-dideoxygalactose transaminase|nr:DegT/DnrJ/EryC1/StrS family aminotransferase [Tannerella sp.]